MRNLENFFFQRRDSGVYGVDVFFWSFVLLIHLFSVCIVWRFLHFSIFQMLGVLLGILGSDLGFAFVKKRSL